MLLFLLTSLLLFFITWFVGVVTKQLLEKWLSVQLFPNAVELFLLGLVSSFVYFSVLSFFFPVNYLSLLPLLAVALVAYGNKQRRLQLHQHISNTLALFVSKKNIAFVAPFIILFIVHAVLPPSNWDSSGYHYDAIKWYEQYKVVPGLANVHTRLAYNPASFIISAAYSFTGLFGQAIYPLNVVLSILFYAWIIKKILLSNSLLNRVVISVAAILLFKTTLVNIPCPSADLLASLLLFYCGVRALELVKQGKQSLSDYVILFILIVFSVAAKLSAIPTLLVIPVLFFFVVKKEKKPLLLVQIAAIAMAVLLPWMGRNLVMSGYLLYPIIGTNPVHFDWSVPNDVIRLDYVYSKYGPRTVAENLGALQQMNMVDLFLNWMQYLRSHYLVGLLIVLPAIAAPVVWLLFLLLKKNVSRPVLLLCFSYYFFLWVWITNAPEFRFGTAYIVLAIALPLIELSSHIYRSPKAQLWLFPKAPLWLLSIPFYFCCWHYTIAGIHKGSTYPFSPVDCWLKPLRSHRYFINNDLVTFNYVELKNGVKLYLSDRQHECLNVDGPCMIWRYGKIEMRGEKIEDGFRNVKDETRQNYPFIWP